MGEKKRRARAGLGPHSKHNHREIELEFSILGRPDIGEDQATILANCLAALLVTKRPGEPLLIDMAGEGLTYQLILATPYELEHWGAQEEFAQLLPGLGSPPSGKPPFEP